MLEQDSSTLALLGIKAEAMAGRIREIVGEAISRSQTLDGGTVGHFRISFRWSKGFQECPWGCERQPWDSMDFVIENCRSGAKLRAPGLIVHLIDEHRFFEGLESPYRVDPRQVAEVLELQGSWWSRFWGRWSSKDGTFNKR